MLDETLIYRCDAIRDADGMDCRPGEVAVRDGRITYAGPPRPTQSGERPVLLDGLVMPAMVNAHAHLELTRVGPQPYDDDFPDWVMMLNRHRPADAAAVAEAVSLGAGLSRAAGVGTIGDIGNIASLDVLRASGLIGVLFHELLGIAGEPLAASLKVLEEIDAEPPASGAVRFGLEPHAPYSTSPGLYRAATELAVKHSLPLTTHIAELREEAQFVASASGRFRQFLEQIGRWEAGIANDYSDGLTPIQWMHPHLRRARWLLAHCNYVSDEDIAILAETRASVAYCPVASEYFDHRDHRYRDMLAAGVNVCLGTDSIVCQPPDEPQPLGMLPQMRRLFQRDAADPDELLAMATTRGMTALGLDPQDATLAPGAPANLVRVAFDVDDPTDPLTQVLTSRYPVTTIDSVNPESNI